MATKRIRLYYYTGKNRAGKKVNGAIRADTVKDAIEKISKKSIKIKNLRKTETLYVNGSNVDSQTLVFFTQQLALMISSGIPILQSLELVANALSHPEMFSLIHQIIIDVEEGQPLSVAMSHYPLCFNSLYISLVDAGEKAGVLDSMLQKMGTYIDKSIRIRKKIKSAAAYPLFVLSFAFFVIFVMMVWVIPSFQGLFKNAGASLPKATQVLVDMSEFFRAYKYQMIGGILGGGFGLQYLYKTSIPVQRAILKILLQIPLINTLILTSTVARFVRTLSIMIIAGLPIVEAIEISMRASSNYFFEQKIKKAIILIQEGEPISKAFEIVDDFPNLALQMIQIGEQTGNLDGMLEKVANIYEEKTDDLVAKVSGAVEPIIILFTGGIVGFIIIAMYMPIFSLGSTIGK